PLCRLLFEIFPPTTRGWETGGATYGFPVGHPGWGLVNHWAYYSPGSPADPATFDGLDAAAAETLATKRWRAEVERWQEVERPAVLATNLDLQAIDPERLDDAALTEHFQRVVDHYSEVAKLHFAHSGFDVAGGLLFEATNAWGVDHGEVVALLAGASPASRETARRLAAIASALRAAGAGEPASLDDVRAVPAAAAALGDYLEHYGWRVYGNDMTEPTLLEQPGVVVESIRAQMRAGDASAPQPDVESVRSQVPDDERARFDELLHDARLCYQLRDDDVGITWAWPLGLIRRAVLEIGRRLEEPGRVEKASHVLDADTAEITALLGGAGPSAAELADRAASRLAAQQLDPPQQLGTPLPEEPAPPLPPNVQRLADARNALWSGPPAPTGRLRGTGIGNGVARGRACVLDEPNGITDLRPGDVIVASMTTAGHNALFPMAVAVTTSEGGPFSHSAILAREFDLPAVVGVAGLLEEVRHGDTVEVDADAGEVRVIR
ncbi:MAG: hypothetical protein JO367_03935, partial [Actinobacteria bacterium]|nr:hypothetical protein [Actinomycetota bacterium]